MNEYLSNYFRDKVCKTCYSWRDILNKEQGNIFTILNIDRLDILEDIKNTLDDALHQGETSRWFIKQLTPTLQNKGWWNKPIIIDNGTSCNEIPTNSEWLDCIYRTHMHTAYMAARYRQMLDSIDSRPYWMYEAVNDNRTRLDHGALDGLILKYDDPFWKTHFPPNGPKCRCKVSALSEFGMKKHGLTVCNSRDYLIIKEATLSDWRTGEKYAYTIIGYQLPGKMVSFADIGFSIIPG